MEVSGDEEKNVHLVLDGIVVRLKSDVAAAQKKHVDAEKAFEKAADVLKSAKTELDKEQITFNAAKTTLDIADVAVKKSTEDFKKESDEASSAQQLAEDETWKTDVQDLKSSIEAVETLRVEVEKLNDEYVHSTTGPTTAVPTSTAVPTTVPSTTGPPYVALAWGTKDKCPGGRNLTKSECQNARREFGNKFWITTNKFQPPGCNVRKSTGYNSLYWNTSSTASNLQRDHAPLCLSE